MSDSPDPTRAVWPAMMVGALILGGLSLAPWGYGDEGVEPTINGLGEVSVPGASADDLAVLQDHTLRPALAILVLAAIIVLAALIAWWKVDGRTGTTDRVLALGGAAFCGLAALVATVQGIRVVADPAARLFSTEILASVADVEGPILHPSWGAYGVVVVGALLTIGAGTAAWFHWRENSRTSNS